MRPWYLRWCGIAILAYIAVTAVLGIGFLVASRRAPTAERLAGEDVLRIGGFTQSGIKNLESGI